MDVDTFLEGTQEIESLSVYGLWHWLGEASKLVSRAERAETAKKPTPAEESLASRKEEVAEVQTQLRRALGALLAVVPGPLLTAREKPLARSFLQEQLQKLQAQGSTGDAKALERAVDRLNKLLESAEVCKTVPESQAVTRAQTKLKELEEEWKQVAPKYERWQQGKEKFRSNDDLQALRRRYEQCNKERTAAMKSLEKALMQKRDPNEKPEPRSNNKMGPDWAAVAKKPPAQAAGGVTRPVKAGSRVGPPAARPSWGVMSWAQRLRAKASLEVRQEAEALAAKAEAEAEGDDWTPDDAGTAEDNEIEVIRSLPAGLAAAAAAVPKAAAPPKAVMPKKPPPLPAHLQSRSPVAPAVAQAVARASADEQEDVDGEDEGNDAGGVKYTASAKRKGKAKKKSKSAAGGSRGSEGDDDEDELSASISHSKAGSSKLAGTTAPSWLDGIQKTFSGSLIAELLSPSGWVRDAEDVDGSACLAHILELLPMANPLGLSLSLEWPAFFDLEIDGGPPHSSKRGAPTWLVRLQQNVPYLFGHYLTILFMAVVMHELTHFGLMLPFVILQFALLLAPPVAALSPSGKARALQVMHVVVWILFLRAIWLLHLFLKMFAVVLSVGHAYVVNIKK